MPARLVKTGMLFAFTVFMCLSIFGICSGEDIDSPKVLAAFSPLKDSNTAGLGDTVTLKVSGLQDLLDEAKAEDKKIILFLDRMPLGGLYPEIEDIYKNELVFFLTRNETSKPTWSALFRNPQFLKPVAVSVGIEGKMPIRTEVDDSKKFNLIVVRKTWFIVCALALLLILGFFWKLATSSGILRDPGPKEPEVQSKYSLARTQMAVWFFLVISSYLFIWIITGELASITESTLVLIGISAATALGAAAVDKQRENGTDKIVPSKGFLNDILTDQGGISFHRFQIFAWTIVLVIIFVSHVYRNLSMPEFNGTLLALMGISSGTYIGFKFPEVKS